MSNVRDVLIQLASSPLGGLLLTLPVYAGSYRIYRRSGLKPIFNPVFSAASILVLLLLASGVEYQAYFRGAQLIDFLLGPAVVALAVPLFTMLDKMREATLPIAGAVLSGAITASGSAVGIAWLCGASAETLRSIAPKSVTAPVAMSIAQDIGGVPSLAAVFVILTGMFGAAVATWTLDLARNRRPEGKGPRDRSHGSWTGYGARTPGRSNLRCIRGTRDGAHRARKRYAAAHAGEDLLVTAR